MIMDEEDTNLKLYVQKKERSVKFPLFVYNSFLKSNIFTSWGLIYTTKDVFVSTGYGLNLCCLGQLFNCFWIFMIHGHHFIRSIRNILSFAKTLNIFFNCFLLFPSISIFHNNSIITIILCQKHLSFNFIISASSEQSGVMSSSTEWLVLVV